MKKISEWVVLQKGHSKAAGEPVRSSAGGNSRSRSAVFFGCFVRSFELCHTLFDSCVVDTQELVGPCRHVDIVGFALGTFLVQELVHSFVSGTEAQIDRHELK